MAKMIPKFGPAETESRSEPLIYNLLEAGLSDEFTVIHSLPWLCAAAKELDASFIAPTGEIDFLILHPTLGVLAIEVKGGHYRIEAAAFVLVNRGVSVDALGQTRRNTHGLARWLAGKSHIRCLIGYALCFPDSHFRPDQLPPGLVDPSGPTLQTITLTFDDMPRFAQRIREVMEYWQAALKTGPLGMKRTDEIRDALCPNFDGSPEWAQRVVFDNHFWLRLTDEQAAVVNKIFTSQRSIITGWPGTGKTLIGIEVARRLKASGARIAVVTYNTMLADYLTEQLADERCDVFTWHKLCGRARTRIGLSSVEPDGDWFQNDCATDLQSAIDAGLLDAYDALILDEAQALRPGWCALLAAWFTGKRIVALCDETQVFSFEKERTTLAALSGILDGARPFHLTIVMRMPRAVTDRLNEVLPSPIQLSSPRKFDAATVREMVVDDLETCLTVITEGLFSDGIQEEEIVFLCKYWDVPAAVEQFRRERPGTRLCTVSRFRGMEAPVIIIVSAEEFDDLELFCAYSRATTVCLVLFSAHRLLRPKEGAFLTGVVGKSENREILEGLRHRSFTRTLLASHPQKPIEAINSATITWSDQWKCWMVQCVRSSPLTLWADFLATSYPWPVLYWYEDSHESAQIARKKEGDYSVSHTPVSIAYCPACEGMAPLTPVARECHICAGTVDLGTSPVTRGQVRKLIEIDQMLGCLIDGSLEDLFAGIRKLPMLLAVAALAQRAVHLHPHEEIHTAADDTSTADLYRWACALVKSLILLRAAGSAMVLADVSRDTYHPDLAGHEVDLPKWHRTVASAFNLYFKYGYLLKVEKGHYTISGIGHGEHA